MSTIYDQSEASSVVNGDLFIIWSTGNGAHRKISTTTLMTYVSANMGAASGTSLTVSSYAKTTAVLVSALPAAATVGAGARSMVTDATQTLTAGIGAVVAGAGANIVPVVSDGTNWRIG